MKSGLKKSCDADVHYQAALAETKELLARLLTKVGEHKARQTKDPRNWGFVGDLQHWNHTLLELLGDDEAGETLRRAGYDRNGNPVVMTIPK